MLEPAALPLGSRGYRALGLIGNPFRYMSWSPAEDSASELVVHAAASRCSAAIDASLAAGNADPVWLSSDVSAAAYFRRLAVSEIVYTQTNNAAFNTLVANVPFPMLSNGRVRSTLGILAERLAGDTFSATLGLYAARALADLDDELPEASALSAEELADVRTRFSADPTAAAVEFFGEDVGERGTDSDLMTMMRVTTMRQELLPTDPEESEEPASEDVEPDQVPEVVAPEEVDDLPERVREYVLAHLRAHVSPVIARAVSGYVEEGTDRVGQELKITRAPRKTLHALTEFAAVRFRGIAVIYDDFDSWPAVPEDLKGAICASMTEMRWKMKPKGVLVFAPAGDETPELEEQFASARKVDWRFVPLLQRVSQAFDKDAAQELVRWSALEGGADASVTAAVDRFFEESGGELERFVQLAGAWIDEQAAGA